MCRLEGISLKYNLNPKIDICQAPSVTKRAITRNDAIYSSPYTFEKKSSNNQVQCPKLSAHASRRLLKTKTEYITVWIFLFF